MNINDTKKTQEVANQRKESQEAIAFYEGLKQNPQLAQQLKNITPIPRQVDPATARVSELENRVYDMMIQTEINTLQNKYKDFDVREVLNMAQSKKMNNLEDAYLLVKANKATTVSVPDSEALKKQLRQEILKELESERNATQTIISSNDNPSVIVDDSPKLSPAEMKVARMMKLSDADYVKWRDIGKKKK
jgi:hypothetical protein